jgi:hypothetical protein
MAMNSVCIRRPAESSGKSRLRLQGQALEGRHLGENLLAVGLVDVFEDVDGVVAVDGRDAAGDVVVGQRLDEFGADRIVDLGQRREVEAVAEQLHQRQRSSWSSASMTSPYRRRATAPSWRRHRRSRGRRGGPVTAPARARSDCLQNRAKCPDRG